MKNKIFIISLLLFVCFLITGNEAFAVTVYNETDFRNALSQQQSTITIANSIDFYSAITINYNVTINAGSNDNAMRCKNKVSNFITVNSGKTLTLVGVVIDVRGSQGSAGITCIRIPSGAKMNFQGSLIDGGMSNTGLLIESGGAVAVTRGDFVYSKYGVRVQGNGTLTHSNSSSMNFWNNTIGLLYESTATCTMPNSKFYNNTTAMQVSKGTVNFNGGSMYDNTTGIYVTGGIVNMSGGSIYRHTNGINVSSGTMNLKGGNVYSNSYGAIVGGGTMNHSGGTIYSNSNHGVSIRGATYNLTGGTVKTNTKYGVALENGYSGTFKMTSGTITGNTSYAVYNSQSGDNCIIHGGTVSGYVYLALADNYVTTNTSYPTLSVRPSTYAFKRKLVKTDSNANANSEISKVTMYANGSWYKYVDGQYIVVWTGGNVIVNCIDEGDNSVIQTETKNGTIGTTVTLTDPTISGYELVTKPSTTTYTYAQADQTVIYGFKKVSNLVVKYIDANTGEVMVTETVPLKEGDSYTASVRDIPGYENTLKPTNETITMGREDTELVYEYKKISDGVDVKYVDQVTGDVLASEHIDGLEKDAYTTSAKDIDGYELVVTPDNATGEMTVDLITVTYEYRKNSNVIVKFIDENHNAEIATQVITKYKEGDTYTTTEKDIGGYELTGNSGNTSGTVERADIEVTYKYKKISEGVDVKYVDQVTGDVLASEHLEGLEKDSYTTLAKTIDGYELVKTPDNTTGEMTVDLITVTYEYRKNSNIIVKFIDENYNTEISDQVITKYKEGDAYTTAKKDIAGYELTSQSDNTSGTVVRTDIEVTYKYKKISDGVDVKYIDQVTGEELVTEHIDGLEKDGYTTSAKDIDGYELVKTPDNTTGEMTVDLITVTYEYRKNSNVIVKYIDQNKNTELVEQIVTKYKEGDSYTTEEKSIFGYELIGTTDNTSGTVGRENIEVIYQYKKTSDGVYISYIDQVTGEELAETIHIDGLEQDPYTSEAKDIDGYELVKIPDNKDGVLAVGKVTVVYEYRKNSYVTVKYIDENYGTTIVDDVVTKYKEGDLYETEEKQLGGYELTGKTANIYGTVVREDITVEYRYKKISQGVDVKFIDQVTGDELASEHIDGLEKDSYTTTAKTIDGYELVKTPDNKYGEMIVDLTTVVYEYRKNSNVIVKYIDENYGTNIVDDIVTKYKEGDAYTTEEKSFDGYKLTGKSDNLSGTVVRDDIVVTYEYKKISEGVDIKYIDQATGLSIADTVHFGGLEKDTYTTTPIDIDDYVLVFTSDNANGELAVDLITVVYEYRMLSDVTAKFIDENYGTEITDEVVDTYKEGDPYSTQVKTFDGYVLTSKTDNTNGIVGREDIVVEYRYKKISEGVNTRFIDQVTGDEIATTVQQSGLEKDTYTTTPKEVSGYELVLTPDNATGEMVVDLTTVTYEYRLVSKVTTKYIDVNSRTEIVTAIENKYKEGDSYTTEEKVFEGYQLVNKTDNTSGTMERSNIEVVYEYKKISQGIEVVFVDQVTGDPITASVVKTGLENEAYTTEPKVVEGYELVLIPVNASGRMTVGKITVKYEYRKLSDVVAKYIDVNYNEEITSEVRETLKEGDVYTTEEKVFEGYQLVNKTNNTSGTMVRSNIEVVYEYKKISEGVDVKYIDQVTGEEIADIEHKDGLEKDNYTTEPKDIKGYELVKTPTNKNGEMTVDKITVTYEYRLVSKVITKHIDANTGKEIVEAIGDEYKEGDSYTTLPKDLVGYVITKTPENKEGTIGRETIEVIYEYKKISDGLVVKYIDQITGDVMETETYTGNEEDLIQLEEKSYEGYILSKRPAVSEIKLTVEPQEVRFYYKKLININIIAIDGVTGEEIYTKVQTGVEGEAYETKPVILPGYEISKMPDNASGTYTREDVNVIYEYKRISEGVIVTYVDKDTREVLDTKTITGFVGEEYATEKNTYEKYDFVEVSGNPKGKLEIDQIEVTYYYSKKVGTVEIVYADEEGNELLKEELTGRVDEAYEIEIKEINNYRIKEVVGETEGAYTIEKQIVKFVMEKLRGKVIVNLLDQDGNLIGQLEEEDFVGETFEVELPEKEGYYIDGDNKVTVEYIDGEIVINVNYIKILVEEPPATGDINIALYVITTLVSVILIKRVTLKNTKN